MSKRLSQPASLGLFDALPAAPAPVPVQVSRGFSPDQERRARLVAGSLQRDIARFQQQLARPLTSWDEQGMQVIEANVALSFTVKSLAEFLPIDLQPLIAQLVDLRAQIVLRMFEEG